MMAFARFRATGTGDVSKDWPGGVLHVSNEDVRLCFRIVLIARIIMITVGENIQSHVIREHMKMNR